MANDIVKVNTLQFSSDLKAFAERLQVDLKLVVKKVAIDLYTKVTERTPVDTGRARASWNISLGNANTTTQPPGQYGDMQSNVIAAAAAKAEQVLGQGTTETVWIANGLPYINRLNAGHSQQAPAAFVETAIAEVEAGIDVG